MSQPPIHALSASDAAAGIRAGILTSEALVVACLARIEARESEVGAWQYLDSDNALEQARAADHHTAQWMVAESWAQAAVETVAEALRSAGARVRDADLPKHWSALIDAQKIITAYETAHNYVYETIQHAYLLSEPFRVLNERGWRTSRDTYTGAKQAVASAIAQFGGVVAGYDALITPAAIGETPLAATGTGDPLMSRMWTALHVPSLVIPVATGPRGLPVGVQLIAPFGADDLLLRVGQWLHDALTEARMNNGCFGGPLF